MSGTKEHPGPDHQEDKDRDNSLDDTFPASDPIAIGGSTGPEDVKPVPGPA